MVNICESLINVVNYEQAKDADRLEPKGKWSGTGVLCSPVADVAPPADRRDLTHSGIQAERGKPVCSPYWESKPQGEPMEHAGKGGWKKRRPFCNEMDRDCAKGNITPRESGQTSIWSLITREFGKPSKEEKQMAVMKQIAIAIDRTLSKPSTLRHSLTGASSHTGDELARHRLA